MSSSSKAVDTAVVVKALRSAAAETVERIREGGGTCSAKGAVALLGQIAAEAMKGVGSVVRVGSVGGKSRRGPVTVVRGRELRGDDRTAYLAAKRFSREKNRAKAKALAAGQPWPPATGPYAGDAKPAQALAKAVAKTVRAEAATAKAKPAPVVAKPVTKAKGGMTAARAFSKAKNRAKTKALAAGQPWPPATGPYAGDPKPAQALAKAVAKTVRAETAQPAVVSQDGNAVQSRRRGRPPGSKTRPLAERMPSLGRALKVRGEFTAPRTKQVSAVQPEKSVYRSAIICLEDGKRYVMLKRPLMTHFGLTPEQYIRKWGLPEGYPMTARSHSERQREAAGRIGLGHRTAEFRQGGVVKVSEPASA